MARTYNKSILLALLLLAAALPVGAQQVRLVDAGSPDTLGTRVYFRQGVSSLDLGFRGNGATLESFVRGIDRLLAEPEAMLHAVTVETGASPEGGVEYNDRLALDRAKSVRGYLLDHLALSPSQVVARGVGADWEGLWHLVKGSDCPWKDEVLRIISESGVRLDPSTANKKACQERMRALDGGRAWAWMLENLFPDLRGGAATLRVIASRPGEGGGRDTIVIIHEYEGPDAMFLLGVAVDRATEAATRNVLAALEKRPKGYLRDSLWRDPILAVRTNMLAPLMNVGVEVPLGNRWSVEADWYWPWVWRQWMNRVVPAQARCFQTLGGYVGGRYWFGPAHRDKDAYRKYRLTGHSLGVIAAGGYYDIEDNWVGRQGEFVAAGLDYTYGLGLGKGRVHLEFDLAVGWGWTQWRGYQVHEEGGRLIGDWNDGTWNGIVPMRAGVSLVFPIFSKEHKVREVGR